jgi:hypothetical protein
MPNMFSGVSNSVVFAAVAPAYANLAAGYAYALHLINTTAAEINAGVINVKTAPADAADPCKPGAFVPMPAVPECGDPTSPGNVVIDLANLPIPAGGQCALSFPCPEQFVQIDAAPAGITAVIVVTQLRRTDWTMDWVTPAFDTPRHQLVVAPPPITRTEQAAQAQAAQAAKQPAA